MLCWIIANPVCSHTGDNLTEQTGKNKTKLSHSFVVIFNFTNFVCSFFRTYNCRKAMEIAKREFDIPVVLEPEYLASPYLDELSGMTYLSYFMKEGSPGFYSTLRWVNSQLLTPVTNFTVRYLRHNLIFFHFIQVVYKFIYLNC